MQCLSTIITDLRIIAFNTNMAFAVERHSGTKLFIEYKYQMVIDLCGNFTIYTYTKGRWQKKVHIIIIHNNRYTMKHKIYKIGQCIQSI